MQTFICMCSSTATLWPPSPRRHPIWRCSKSLKLCPPASPLTAESLSIKSSPSGEVTLQVGSPLLLTCEVQGLPPEVGSGLLVQWMRRGSVSSDGVEVHERKNTVNTLASC